MIAVFLRTLVSLTISGGIIAAVAAIARFASRGRIPGRFMRLVWIAAVLRFLVPVFIPVSVPARAVPENLPVVRYVYRTPAANAPGQTEGDMNAQVEGTVRPDAAGEYLRRLGNRFSRGLGRLHSVWNPRGNVDKGQTGGGRYT